MPVLNPAFPLKTQGEGTLADKTACVCFKPGDIYGKNDLKNRFTVERLFKPFLVCIAERETI